MLRADFGIPTPGPGLDSSGSLSFGPRLSTNYSMLTLATATTFLARSVADASWCMQDGENCTGGWTIHDTINRSVETSSTRRPSSAPRSWHVWIGGRGAQFIHLLHTSAVGDNPRHNKVRRRRSLILHERSRGSLQISSAAYPVPVLPTHGYPAHAVVLEAVAAVETVRDHPESEPTLALESKPNPNPAGRRRARARAPRA